MYFWGGNCQAHAQLSSTAKNTIPQTVEQATDGQDEFSGCQRLSIYVDLGCVISILALNLKHYHMQGSKVTPINQNVNFIFSIYILSYTF